MGQPVKDWKAIRPCDERVSLSDEISFRHLGLRAPYDKYTELSIPALTAPNSKPFFGSELEGVKLPKNLRQKHRR